MANAVATASTNATYFISDRTLRRTVVSLKK